MFIVRVKYNGLDYYVFCKEKNSAKIVIEYSQGITSFKPDDSVKVNLTAVEFALLYNKILKYDKIYEFKQLEQVDQ